MKHAKRMLTLLLALMIVVAVIPFGAFSASAANTGVIDRLNALRTKFPEGKYWNHYANETHNNKGIFGSCTSPTCMDPDKVTSSPCTTHNGNAGVGCYDCNCFDGGIQCWGFASKVFYDVFGVKASAMSKRTDIENVAVGDWIRCNNDTHSAVVIARNGNTITTVDGNYSVNCMIHWGRTSDISTINYFKHASNYDTINASSSSTTPAVTVTWTYCDKEAISTTDPVATLAATANVSGTSTVNATLCGISLYSSGNVLLAEKTEETGASGRYSYVNMWYDVQNELGVTLSPAATYYYKFFIVILGTTYTSPMYSFTAGGTHTHVYGEWQVTRVATCTETGWRTRYCSCGATESEFSPSLGHVLVTDPEVAATCTTTGLTAGSHCSRCGTVLSDRQIAPALGHNYTIPAHVDPTTTEDGYNGHYCSRCGDLNIEEVLPAIVVPDNAAQAVVESKTAKPGDEVTLTVTLKNADPIRSMSASDLVYDANALTLTKVQWAVSSAIMKTWDSAKGKGAVTLADTAVDANGAVLTLTFAVKENAAEGDYTVGLQFTVNAGNAASNEAVPVVPGKLTVKNYTVGDLNGDDLVTDDDAIYLLMYTFFAEDYPVNQPVDYNRDGYVTDDDAIWLLMYTFFPEDYPVA